MKKIITLLLISVIALTIFVVWFVGVQNSSLHIQEEYEIGVTDGDTFYSVLDNLKNDGVVSNVLWYKIYSKLTGEDLYIQTGNFILTPENKHKDLIYLFRQGVDKTNSLTFLEGWRVDEYIALLVKNGYTRGELENCLQTCTFEYDFITEDIKKYRYEGYLYPDTYNIGENEIPYSIFNRMLSNFEQKANGIGLFERENSEKIINIAGMVEREVRTLEDKGIVAGILENRIEVGMSLGIDATVLYAHGDWELLLDRAALDIDSPYNTRKYAGLPPSAISNPSIETIEAAMNPTGTDFYYYLNHPSTGATYFGKTLEEHNVNKAKYLR